MANGRQIWTELRNKELTIGCATEFIGIKYILLRGGFKNKQKS